jgi:exopolyphosphatase / guanosine-5'-triphosphate,3'-diphosphate pyrophosphatase
LTGFSEGERAVISNIARYHRGSAPKTRHPEFAALNAADQRSVIRLGAILRLADALDRNHEGRVSELLCKREGGVVTIEVRSELDTEKELSEAQRKRAMFEYAFNCKLNLIGVRTRRKRV